MELDPLATRSEASRFSPRDSDRGAQPESTPGSPVPLPQPHLLAHGGLGARMLQAFPLISHYTRRDLLGKQFHWGLCNSCLRFRNSFGFPFLVNAK